jgi:hypothetical protein
MNKREWLSVFIRIFGVYLLVYGFLKIPLAMSDFLPTLRITSLAKQAADVGWTSFVCSLVGMFLQLFFGYYLLCRSEKVLNWIDKSPAAETGDIA